MSTKVETSTVPQTLLNSPLMTFFTLIAAIVIGSSLLESNELLFPPVVTSISFWALLPVYVVSLDAWFGVAAWARNIPFSDRPAFRATTLLLVLTWAWLLGLMYLGSRAHVSLFGYLWGVVALFVFLEILCGVRIRLLKTTEPLRIYRTCGILALTAAIAYSIWSITYPPVPSVISWVFVSIAFVILVGMRVWMKIAHTWRPEEKQ